MSPSLTVVVPCYNEEKTIKQLITRVLEQDAVREVIIINDASTDNSLKLIKEFQDENKTQHDEVNEKIASFEKWRWMLMGAGVLAGAIGWPTLSALLGM